VNVENAQPPVMILSPEEGSLLSGTVTITVYAPDSTHFIAISVSTDSVTHYALNREGTRTIDYPERGWRAEWQTRLFADGDWEILAEAYSFTHELIGTDSVKVELDNTPPQIEIFSPTEAEPAMTRPGRLIELCLEYTEEHPSYLEIEMIDGTITLVKKVVSGIAPGNVEMYESIFVPLGIPEGSYTLLLRLTDLVAHKGTDTEDSAIIVTTVPLKIEDEGTITIIPDLRENLEIYYQKALLKGTVSNRIVDIGIRYDNGITDGVEIIEGVFRKILSLHKGTNTITVYYTDIAGNTGSLTKTILYRIPEVSQVVTGGVVRNPNGSVIEIPDAAMLSPAKISFSFRLIKDVEFKPGSIRFLRSYHSEDDLIISYEITAGRSGYCFHRPVKVVLVYDDSNWDENLDGVKDANEIDESRLSAFYYDEVSGEWIEVGGVVDTVNNRVTFYVNHLSIFSLGVSSEPKVSDLDVWLNRNPFRQREGTVFEFRLPKPGWVHIRIFDLAGDLVRDLDRVHYPETKSQKWDGLNDVSDRYVGSGIYIYQLKVEYDDGKSEQIIKPIGVVK
jgi:hypothetical protein